MKIQKDKIGHFVGCMVIAVGVGMFVSPAAGFWWSTGVAAAKEVLWDWILEKGTPSWADFFASVLGAFAGATLISFL